MSGLDLFPDAPKEQPKIFGSAKFSFEHTCRNEIRRWWVEKPTRWVAWLMLNPSDAGADRNDPTAQRVTHFSRAWGFDGWIGVNLYPLGLCTISGGCTNSPAPAQKLKSGS